MKTYMVYGKQSRYYYQIIEANSKKEARARAEQQEWEESNSADDEIKIYKVWVKE